MFHNELDELNSIINRLEDAHILLCSTCENYFERADIEPGSTTAHIFICQYRTYSTLLYIVEDMLLNIEKECRSLNDRLWGFVRQLEARTDNGGDANVKTTG